MKRMQNADREQKIMDQFRSKLEEKLDEQYPKVSGDPHGRAEALLLYAWACTLARNAIREALKENNS